MASAFLNDGGVKALLKAAKRCEEFRFIVGLDFPTTDPSGLRRVLRLARRASLRASRLENGNTFHPKVYIVRPWRGSPLAVVGSSNCTGGGLGNNLELNLKVTKPSAIREICKWFGDLENDRLKGCKVWPMSWADVEQYETTWKRTRKTGLQLSRRQRGVAKSIGQNHAALIRNWNALVAALHRGRTNLRGSQRGKQATCRAIRRCLDYPLFRVKRTTAKDWEEFYGQWDLGHLLPFAKRRLWRSRRRLFAACRDLVAEGHPLRERVDRIHRLRDVGPNLFSKILAAHDPRHHPVWNTPVISELRHFGLSFARGSTMGEKYDEFQRIMVRLLKESQLPDMLCLDDFLYKRWRQRNPRRT